MGLYLILFSILCLFSVEICCTCDNIYCHLSSKTPYKVVENDVLDNLEFPGCKPEKIWMILRHGARYPSEKIITFMQNDLLTLRDDIVRLNRDSKGSLNEYQLSLFEKWVPLNVSVLEEKFLSPEGGREMQRIARRIKMQFGSSIFKPYDNETYLFRHTPTERTNNSARNFAIGLFGDKVAEQVSYLKTAKDDKVLRFYKSCKYYQKYVKKNPKAYKQVNLYILGSEMNRTLRIISNVMGFDKPITYKLALYLYQICAFEQSFWDENYISPWCFLFDTDTISVMEYSMDLKYYWIDGYGYPITRKLPCTVLIDVLKHFSNESRNIATFQFTHSGTILKLLSYLGLYGTDDALVHDKRDTNRVWRSSYIDTFSSNLAFILYRCGTTEKILILHQEKPVRLAECDDELCPLETIYAAREKSLMECNLKKMCKISKDEL